MLDEAAVSDGPSEQRVASEVNAAQPFSTVFVSACDSCKVGLDVRIFKDLFAGSFLRLAEALIVVKSAASPRIQMPN